MSIKERIKTIQEKATNKATELLEKVRAYKAESEAKNNIKRAERLAKLKKERERAEGKARLITLEAKEKERITKANKTIEEDRGINKVIKKFSSAAKKAGEKQKQERKPLKW
jgi:GTP cyclohydrolase II